MLRNFKFFRGYIDNLPIEIDWDNINRINDINRLTVTPGYGTITIPNYPNYFIGDYPLTGTITTTGTGTYTIPYNGTINTATGFSLTTSNTNGTTTYTTAGFGGTFTTTGTISTNTFYNSNIK